MAIGSDGNEGLRMLEISERAGNRIATIKLFLQDFMVAVISKFQLLLKEVYQNSMDILNSPYSHSSPYI